MKIISANLPTSLGDLIIIKAAMDAVKHQYSQINFNFHKALWNGALDINQQQRNGWDQYLNEVGQLFFSEAPYRIQGQHKFYDTIALLQQHKITPVKPELSHLLCKGQSLNIGQYIVVTTKIRGINKYRYYPNSISLYKALKEINQKYKIVILGERIVERRKEYDNPEIKDGIFGIYEDLIVNLDNVLDLTVPALGNTQSTLKQIQQDCLIMKEAKCCITIGIGGNHNMMLAVADMAIGYREDSNWLAEILFSKNYNNAFIIKNWNQLINKIQEYR